MAALSRILNRCLDIEPNDHGGARAWNYWAANTPTGPAVHDGGGDIELRCSSLEAYCNGADFGTSHGLEFCPPEGSYLRSGAAYAGNLKHPNLSEKTPYFKDSYGLKTDLPFESLCSLVSRGPGRASGSTTPNYDEESSHYCQASPVPSLYSVCLFLSHLFRHLNEIAIASCI